MWSPRGWIESLIDRSVRWLDRVAEDGLTRLAWWKVKSWFGTRLVQRKLVVGERVLANVKHSMILHVPYILVLLVGVALAVAWLPQVPARVFLLALIIVVAIIGYAAFKILFIARDRFVVTDSRVFRVWGLFTLNEAEMEIVRVLDITVNRPWYLRPFRSGHIVLENAGQEQGLREIHFITRPEDVSMEIHHRRREMSGLTVAPTQPEEKPASKPRRPDHPRTDRPHTARRRDVIQR